MIRGVHCENPKRDVFQKLSSAYLKALLVQAAWVLWRARPNEPMVVWVRAIADHRGRRIAIIALARKLATVMWSMWREPRPGNPDPEGPPKEVRTELTFDL